jgi:hypothetical protein
MTRQGDLSNADTSTMQRLSAWYRLNGFPEGMLTASDVEELGAQATGNSDRVAFGRFSAGDAAIGLVLGTLFLLYLGTRVVVVK